MIEDDAHLDDMAEADASEVEYMFAQTARGLAVDPGAMTLQGVSPSTLWFSDRPHRLTGHIATSDFVGSWGEGDDSFAADPPQRAALDLHRRRSARCGGGSSRTVVEQW